MSDFAATFDRTIAAAVSARSSEPVSDDLDLLRLGFDSLAMVDLMLDLDEALGCQVPPEELAGNVLVTVVGELRALFAAYVAAS